MTYKINVYKLWWNDNDDMYVGSTKERLSKRMSGHRASCKRIGDGGCFLYKKMKENGTDFKYVLLESADVSNTDEKHLLEQKHIDLLHPNLNSNRAHTSKEDERLYQKKRNDMLIEWKKKNGYKIKVINPNSILCPCGGRYMYVHRRQHYIANIHCKFKDILQERSKS